MSSKPSIQPKTKLFHTFKKLFFWKKQEFSTNPRALLLRLFLYLLLILFPASLAKRFIMPQSYVSGLLIDYLIPTFYLIEVLVLSILIFGKWSRPKHKLFSFLLLSFLFSLLPSVLKAPFQLIAWMRFAEIAIWLGFSLWVSQNINPLKNPKLMRLIGLGVMWVTVLAFFQLCFQRSILGYWFLGEPYITPSLGGAATGSLLGREILLPYGTFPHPNVMGGVLSVLALWLVAGKKLMSALFSLGGTVISFSQTAYISLFLGLLALPFANRIAFIAPFYLSDLLNNPSIQRRWDLLGSAWEMIKSAPLTGVGLGNFTYYLPKFGVPEGLTLFIQPVHNIFALIGAESGVASLALFAALFVCALVKTIRHKSLILTVSLLQLIFLGLFDHYIYTLPQGLFILSLTLGISFAEAANS